MNERPTPETNASIHVCHDTSSEWHGDWVSADDARRLERERDEARGELSAERALAGKLADALVACERWVNQPCAVKTEANKVLMVWKEARK